MLKSDDVTQEDNDMDRASVSKLPSLSRQDDTEARVKQGGASSGTVLTLDVISSSKLWRLSIGATVAFATFVLVGYTNGPHVSQKSWTGKSERCVNGFNAEAFNRCNKVHTTHPWWEGATYNGPSEFDLAHSLHSIPSLPERQKVLTCLFDSCPNVTKGLLEHSTERFGINVAQTDAIDHVHYNIPIHSMKAKHRYMYLEAEFPNEHFNSFDHSFKVTVNPTVMGTNVGMSAASLVPASSHAEVTVTCPKENLYCNPVPMLRLGNVAYSDYSVDLLLNSSTNLSFDQDGMLRTSVGLPLKGQDVIFFIKFGAVGFTNWLMTFKTLFFITSAIVAAWAVMKHRHLSSYARHLEQNWVTSLAVVLVGFNDPFYAMESHYVTNDLLKVLSVFFQVTYFSLLCLFWLVMLDHIRLTGAEAGKVHGKAFYYPKVLFVGVFWFFTLLAFGYSKYQDDNDPTWDPAVQFAMYLPCAAIAGLLLIFYLGWLLVSFVRASKAISNLGSRYRYFVFFTGGVIATAVIGLSFGAYAPIPINAGEWTGFYALFNLYTFMLVYLYSPSTVASTRSETRALSSDLELSDVKMTTECV